MQKYLLNVPICATDDVIINPPKSWIRIAMKADLVDQHHDVKASLHDAVKHGFKAENIVQTRGRCISDNIAHWH